MQQQKLDGSKSMPRIIELAEFGQAARPAHASASGSMGGLEFVTVILLTVVSLGALVAACCYMCMRQKRYE